MKKFLCFIELVFIITISTTVFASDAGKDIKKDAKQQSKYKHTEKAHKNLFLNYKPPVGRNMPTNREGGGTRGKGDNEQYLAALVPNHVALTTMTQPSLFWYMSKPATTHIEVTINNNNSLEPIAEASLNNQDKGIQRFNLSDYNISLSPGIEYQWFITIVPDPEQRSNDISATGMIRYVKPSKILTEKLAVASGIERSVIYAEEGIWYDALLSITELIDTDPDNKSLRNERMSLLKQIGLNAVNE